jgi:hypothetical protein
MRERAAMPKSRKGKKKGETSTPGAVRMTPEVHDMLLRQREAFRKKFGRDPGPGDPFFFDPNADEPTPMSSVAMEAEVLAGMQKADLSPAFAYAYKKTGLIGVEGLIDGWPADRRKEWNDAVKEYELIEQASKGVDRPDPAEWTTEIPELLISGFTRKDLALVGEILHAIAPIEGRQPLKLITRIEIAAAFLASACDCAFNSADAIGSPGDAAGLYAKTEELVLRRARELYAQDGAA